jgi:hypothetical protein
MVDESNKVRAENFMQKLNSLLQLFRRELRTGGPAAEYSPRVRAAAEPIYSTIVEACRDFEVEAEKDNRRVLKIGVVGPLRGTTFPYERAPHVPVSGNDWCELAVIVEFRLSERV